MNAVFGNYKCVKPYLYNIELLTAVAIKCNISDHSNHRLCSYLMNILYR